MKKIITWILLVASIAVLIIRFSTKAEEIILGIKPKTGISVLSTPEGATVTLDNKEVGKTPYENKDLEVKEVLLKIEKDQAIWQGKINLVAGVIAVIDRDMSKDQASQAGEVLTLKRGKGLTIVSNPTGADIEVDSKLLGKTPTTIDMEPGEYIVVLSHSNHLKRSIKANLPVSYNLTIVSDLAIAEADLTTISTPVITQTPEVLVKNTPTGFLRVRDKASTAGKEVAQVKPGDTLILLEELGTWDRVRLSNGIEGFVSSAYVEKKIQAPK